MCGHRHQERVDALTAMVQSSMGVIQVDLTRWDIEPVFNLTHPSIGYCSKKIRNRLLLDIGNDDPIPFRNTLFQGRCGNRTDMQGRFVHPVLHRYRGLDPGDDSVQVQGIHPQHLPPVHQGDPLKSPAYQYSALS